MDVLRELSSFIFLLIIFGGRGILSHTADDVQNLITSLQQNYSRLVRPPFDQSVAVEVQVGFLLHSIRDFDEAGEQFSCIGMMVITWTDDRIVWNPANYGRLQTLIVESDNFWVPPMLVRNSVDNIKRIGGEEKWLVRYVPTGLAVYYPTDIFTTYCEADVVNYPWDRQTCRIVFANIGYLSNEVLLGPYDVIPILRYYTGDGTWDMLKAGYGTGLSSTYVEFTLQRKPLFVIINVIIPVLFMHLLDLMVFLIPAESGERISFSLTVLLAIAVFLTVVADSLPKSANSIALLSYYILGILGCCILNTCAVIFNLCFFYKEKDTRIPPILNSLILLFNSKRLCLKSNNKTGPEKNRVDGQHLTTGPSDDVQDKTTLSYINGTNENDRAMEGELQQTKPKTECTWKEISILFDRVCFVVAFIVFAILNLVFFIRVTY